MKSEAKRKEACTRIRLKIFPYFLKAREAGNAVPFNILVNVVLTQFNRRVLWFKPISFMKYKSRDYLNRVMRKSVFGVSNPL